MPLASKCGMPQGKHATISSCGAPPGGPHMLYAAFRQTDVWATIERVLRAKEPAPLCNRLGYTYFSYTGVLGSLSRPAGGTLDYEAGWEAEAVMRRRRVQGLRPLRTYLGAHREVCTKRKQVLLCNPTTYIYLGYRAWLVLSFYPAGGEAFRWTGCWSMWVVGATKT